MLSRKQHAELANRKVEFKQGTHAYAHVCVHERQSLDVQTALGVGNAVTRFGGYVSSPHTSVLWS